MLGYSLLGPVVYPNRNQCEFRGKRVEQESTGKLEILPPVASVTTPSDGLTDLAREFCRQYVLNGGRGEQAAIDAGYGGGAANMATRNLCKPKVQAEIQRLSKVTIGAALPVAINRLIKILEMEGEKADPRAQVQAATVILDRAGLHVPKGPAVAVQFNMNGNHAQAIIADVHASRQSRLTQDDG